MKDKRCVTNAAWIGSNWNNGAMTLFPVAISACCNQKPTHTFVEHVGEDRYVHGLCDHHLHHRKEHWVRINVTIRCLIFSSAGRPPCYTPATRFYYDKITSELFGYCEKHHELAKSHGSNQTIRPVNEDEWPVLDIMEA